MPSPAVEPQGWGAILPGLGVEIVRILESRNGLRTLVALDDETTLEVFDCAWGRDVGETWEHVTLNASPVSPDRPVHFVQTQQIVQLVDPLTGACLYARSLSDGEP